MTADKVTNISDHAKTPPPENDAPVTLSAGAFAAIREGLAAATRLALWAIPLLTGARVALNKETRKCINAATAPILGAFDVALSIHARLNETPPDFTQRVPEPLQEIDIDTMRGELENVSALINPDLIVEMRSALTELPIYASQCLAHNFTAAEAAPIVAWAWEAGRRYGMIESISIFDSLTQEFSTASTEILLDARDRNLDISTGETPIAEPGPPPDREAALAGLSPSEREAFDVMTQDPQQTPNEGEPY
jgi:hypothetical protein